jgi:3-deoxy-D-manno-octulosonic acid kinase
LLRFDFSGGTAVIRPCRRGGFIRRMVEDRYFLSNRPLHELRVHTYLHEQGVAVPEPLGVCYERRGVWFRGCMATREVHATDLLEYLVASPADPEQSLHEVGKLVCEMHDQGVYHADLQIRNILVGAEHAYIIDFDKARRSTKVSRFQRARNLLRLRRSFTKNALPLTLFDIVCRGYGIERLPRSLERLYQAKGAVSDAMSGRTELDDAP